MRISGALRAVAAATVSVLTYTQVQCPRCGRMVISFPGALLLETRLIRRASGRGALVDCQKCGSSLEVVAHG